MCGIAGSIVPRRESNPSKGQRLESCRQLLSCRGPDGSGCTSHELGDWQVDLLHTRLAVIDLTDASLQPFWSNDRNHALIFNGEIYNYREIRSRLSALGSQFRTNSDTEVLLEALIVWGENALDLLEGMFAFCFLDISMKQCLLARDRFGIKPLYIRPLSSGGLEFASEITALLKLSDVKPIVNSEVASTYLTFGWSDYSEETFFDGVTSLSPGSLMRIDLTVSKLSWVSEQWWRPSIKETFEGTFDQAAAVLRSSILETVELHMRSDVPVGAALSGGLDSSTLVAAMRHIDPRAEIHAFSFIESSPKYSEESWVDLIVGETGAISHKVQLSKDLVFGTDFQDMIRYQGEPFGSSSIFAQYKVFESVNSAGIKVTLDGQGADEIFAGYQGYPEQRLLSLLERGQVFQAASFIRHWSNWPGRNARSLLVSTTSIMAPALRNSRTLMSLGTLLGVIPPQGASMIRGSTPTIPAFRRDPAARGRRLAEELRFHLGHKRLQGLLRFADRNSMRWSVESRVPFLNSRIVDFCLSLPEDFLVSPKGRTKHILREAIRGLVPDQIADRKDKIGFRADDSNWLRNVNGPQPSIEGLQRLPFVDFEKAQLHLKRVTEGSIDFSDLTWRMLNLATWAEQLDVQAGEPQHKEPKGL